MKIIAQNKFVRILLLLGTNFFLNGCTISSLSPKGNIRVEENTIILTSLLLMLVIVIPVVIMSLVFFIKYNVNNVDEKYSPEWTHSNKVECFIWGIPIIIVIILGSIAWQSAHKLDPKKPIYFNIKPIDIDVIALNWKWLFIYPKEHIATINEITFPVNRLINFRITSNTVMNSFYIPVLGSQMYAMPGMKTNLYLIANSTGHCKGISSNFSGRGFSEMNFIVNITKTTKEFNNWVEKVKKSFYQIDSIDVFQKIAKPKEHCYIQYFSYVLPNLFNKIINKVHF